MSDQKYLTTFDDGLGLVWLYIVAPSPEDISKKYPQLAIVAETPAWLVERGPDTLPVLHVDDTEDDFLGALRAEAGTL